MNEDQISLQRMASQKLTTPSFTTPEEVVSWMGAMQAQDFNMAKLAVGIRMQDGDETKVAKALDKGEIIRTHVLRPTWHFVSAKDIYWMNARSLVRIKKAMAYNDKLLGLTDKVFSKALKVVEKALENGAHLTRDVLADALEKNKIITSENRLAHILMRAELEGIACSGAMHGKQQTYALLSKRVPAVKSLPRDEAITKLTNIYFQSRGPATLADFAWWSGLSPKEAVQGLEDVKHKLSLINIKGKDYWMTTSDKPIAKNVKRSIMLIPAFDEFIISYKDRSASLLDEHTAKAITKNGIFHPVILLNGKAVGIWKRITEKDKIILSPHFFAKPDASTFKLFKQSSLSLERFSGKKIEINYEAT